MSSQVITRALGGNAPQTYELAANESLEPTAIYASYDGTLAGGSFLPCVSYYTQDGHLFARAFPSEQVAAGASADVSFFPGLSAPVESPCPTIHSPLGTLYAWYDFSDSSTLTLDGSGKIASIADKSGNGRTAAQATPAQRPGVATVNGLDAGLFVAASSTTLVTASLSPALAQPLSMALVFTQDSGTSATYFPGPVSGYHPGADAWVFLNGPFDAVASQAGGSSNISVGIAAPFTQQLVIAIFDGASSKLALNSTEHARTLGTAGKSLITLGRGHDNVVGHTDYLDGKLCELVVFAGALTADQLTLNQTYLKTKWATP